MTSDRSVFLCGAALLAVAVPTSSSYAGETKTYTYDALGRLVEVDHTGTANDSVATDYAYDAVGNRTSFDRTATSTPTPTANLSINSASEEEGNALTFTVTRTGNLSLATSVDYATSNATAVAPGDYTASSNTLTFAANQQTATFTVTTQEDSTVESDETFTVTLSNPGANTNIVTATGTGTINNDDVANSPPVAVNDSTTVACGNTQILDLIENDEDADNDPLSLDSVSFVSGTLGGLSIYSSTEIEIVAGTVNNTVVLNYVVEDTSAAQDTGTVTITVFGAPRICTGS